MAALKDAKFPKDTANDPAPPNWQKKPVLVDHIPIPDPNAAKFNNNELEFSDGTIIKPNEYVFVANEERYKPGDIYEDWGSSPRAFGIARIIEFHQETRKASINLLVRPGDVFKRTTDTRELFFTSVITECSIGFFRGKCSVQHPAEVRNFEKYRETPCSFWIKKYLSISTMKLYDIHPESVYSKPVREVIRNEIGPEVKYICCEKSENPPSLSEKNPPLVEIPNDEHIERWPFVYFDPDLNSVALRPPSPECKIGDEHQVQVDEWLGHPLIYYLMGPNNAGDKLEARFLEPSSSSSDDHVDTSLPYVQEMPQGYLARGHSSTSLPISVPQAGLEEFMDICKKKIAPELGVKPYNLNFLDSCTSIFSSVKGDIDEAIDQVRHTCSSQRLVPNLSGTDAENLRHLIDPFTHASSWHKIFNKMKNVPRSDLIEYLWINMPDKQQPWIPPNDLQWDADPPSPQTDSSKLKTEIKSDAMSPADEEEVRNDSPKPHQKYKCVECLTTSAIEWKALPGYLPFDMPSRNPVEEHTFALCVRCARLWYRYGAAWYPYDKLRERIQQGVSVDPDLLIDANTLLKENTKRYKRRHAGQEKKLQTTIKKLEERKSKIQAKVDTGKGTKTESENLSSIEKLDQEIRTVSDQLSELNEIDSNQKDEELLVVISDTTSGSRTHTRARGEQADNADDSDSDVPVDGNTSEPSTPKKHKGKGQPKAKKQKTSDTGEKEKGKPRGRGPQLSIDKASENLTKIKEHYGLRIRTKPEYCVICCQKDPTMPQYHCYFCKLSVHEACYGHRDILYQTKYNDTIWACDCCANLLGLSDNSREYYCKLCPKRPPLYLEWLNRKETEYAPDALKATIDGSWCHNRCAVFTDNVLFRNASTLSGVNLYGMTKDQYQGECSICMRKHEADDLSNGAAAVHENGDNGDKPETLDKPDKSASRKAEWEMKSSSAARLASKVKCHLCDERFHISCAADSGYHFGFIFEPSAKAVILCRKHEQHDLKLVPMTEIDPSSGDTALQRYVLNKKNGDQAFPSQTTSGIVMQNDRKALRHGERLNSAINRSVIVSVSNMDDRHITVNDEQVKCDSCGSKIEPAWISENNKNLCGMCYRSGGGNIEVEPKYLVNKYADIFCSR